MIRLEIRDNHVWSTCVRTAWPCFTWQQRHDAKCTRRPLRFNAHTATFANEMRAPQPESVFSEQPRPKRVSNNETRERATKSMQRMANILLAALFVWFWHCLLATVLNPAQRSITSCARPFRIDYKGQQQHFSIYTHIFKKCGLSCHWDCWDFSVPDARHRLNRWKTPKMRHSSVNYLFAEKKTLLADSYSCSCHRNGVASLDSAEAGLIVEVWTAFHVQ